MPPQKAWAKLADFVLLLSALLPAKSPDYRLDEELRRYCHRLPSSSAAPMRTGARKGEEEAAKFV